MFPWLSARAQSKPDADSHHQYCFRRFHNFYATVLWKAVQRFYHYHSVISNRRRTDLAFLLRSVLRSSEIAVKPSDSAKTMRTADPITKHCESDVTTTHGQPPQFLSELTQGIRGAPPLPKRRSCEQNLGCWRSTLRDGEHRCRLRSVTFGIMQVAPETNIQYSSVRRRVWNSPEERCTPRVEKRNPHGKRPAAIQRQPNLALTPRQRDIRKRVLPLDHDLLPSIKNLSHHW